MGKLLYRKYKILMDFMELVERNNFAMFASDRKLTQFEIEIAVDAKATVPDVCKYVEERFKTRDSLRILSVEFLGCIDFVDLKL